MKGLIVSPQSQSGTLMIPEDQIKAIPSRLLIPKKKISTLREQYSHIYNWHLQEGMEAANMVLVDEEMTSSYFDVLAKMKSEKEASIYQILTVSKSIQRGLLSWSANEEYGGESLLYWATQINKLSDDYGAEGVKDYRKKTGNKKAGFKEAATDFLTTHFPRLAAFRDYEMHKKNIGGLVALMETNAQFNKELTVSPRTIGFSEIDENDAYSLVNLGLQNKISIKNIRLGNGLNPYNISFEIENISGERQLFEIPQGQVFENKIYRCKTQNLILVMIYRL